MSRPRGGGPDGRRSWCSSRCWRRATAPQRSLHSRRSCRTNVTRVVDGDTIHVAIGNQIEKVRYIGINTPEARLRWRDADLLTATLTVTQSKNGRARHIPMNAVVGSLLVDVGARRQRPDDPSEPMFTAAYRTTARAFEQAVTAAQATLASAGKDGSRLEGFTWHGLRHTWASRLVMAGVDPRTLPELGGWRTLTMVERYSHLSPDHLRAAMERLVPMSAVPVQRNGAAELERNLNETRSLRGGSLLDGVEVCDSMSTEG